MDDNWLNILSNRLRNEEIPLPEGDWDIFETNLLRPAERKHKVITWAVIASCSIAASIVFVIVFHNISMSSFHEASPIIDNKEDIIIVDDTDHSIHLDNKQEKIIPSSESMTSPLNYVAQEEQLSIVQNQENYDDYQGADNHTTRSKKIDSIIVNNNVDRFIFEEENKRKQPSILLSPFIKGAGKSTTIKGQNNDLSFLGNNFDSTIMDYYYQMEAHHYSPLSLGLDISLTLTPKIALTTGVSFSVYKSKLSSYVQKVYYLGVPFKIDIVTWHSDHISTWIGAGGKVDRQIYGKFDTFKLKDSSFHWSITSNIGIQYELLPQIGLYFEPELSYYFKPSSPRVLTYRTENPLMVSLGGGIRFNF